MGPNESDVHEAFLVIDSCNHPKTPAFDIEYDSIIRKNAGFRILILDGVRRIPVGAAGGLVPSLQVARDARIATFGVPDGLAC